MLKGFFFFFLCDFIKIDVWSQPQVVSQWSSVFGTFSIAFIFQLRRLLLGFSRSWLKQLLDWQKWAIEEANQGQASQVIIFGGFNTMCDSVPLHTVISCSVNIRYSFIQVNYPVGWKVINEILTVLNTTKTGFHNACWNVSKTQQQCLQKCLAVMKSTL